MKELKIEAPQGYEIDKENSTFERIIFKKKIEIKTWDDLCKAEKRLEGFYVSDHRNIYDISLPKVSDWNRGVFLTKKQAKSARAAAVISQLMPYYGGAITDEEWGEAHEIKHTIIRRNNKIIKDYASGIYSLLAFKSKEQRDEFLKHNLDLVKDYLMID